MSNANLEAIKNIIATQHKGDKEQLKVIFSDMPRIMVEAPAGYGKTTTMTSRIAYLFASNRIPNPKQILGLTFSVNAALKVKREIAGKLPTLIGILNNPMLINEKITITNYHGFCKGILKKYGYLIAISLKKDVNRFHAIGDSDIEKYQNLKTTLTPIELQYLKNIENTIKESKSLDNQSIFKYNELIIQKLLPSEYITHNAIILFVLELFLKYKQIQKFYQNYYTLIVADEFQDTNCIAWSLLDAIISNQTQLLFLGDPLQRIYGFIGALPNIMSDAIKKYDMFKVSLAKNYRFKDNNEMLKLDRNIRINAESCFTPNITSENIASLPKIWGISQQNEAEQITTKVQALMCDSSARIAILFRGRNKNVELVENELSNKKIPYFYGMFPDDDVDYVSFHDKCQDMFIKKFKNQKSINKRALSLFFDNIKNAYATNGKTINSLLKLLDALIKKISIDYANLLPEDKYTLLLDIFENRQLKQSMEYVDSQVILSTIHSAKGLEWDYVILGDVERWVFPGYYVCNICTNKFIPPTNKYCNLPISLSKEFQYAALDELSVFYVGITRAKKQAFVSASAKRLDPDGNEKSSIFSCLVGLEGVKLI